MDDDKAPPKKKETPPIKEPKKTPPSAAQVTYTKAEVDAMVTDNKRITELLEKAEKREETVRLDEYNLKKSKVLAKIAETHAVLAEECKDEHLNDLEKRLDTLDKTKDPNAKTKQLILGADGATPPVKKKGYYDRLLGKMV